jgi:hypothetical protein
VNFVRIHRFLTAVAALLAAGPAGVALAWLYQLFAGRLTFPADLEWMEGGVLTHALRFKEGLQVYVAPSVDFIPFLYTPFYPALLSWLSRFVPLGYTLGRSVSVAAFSLTLVTAMLVSLWPLRQSDRADRWWARLVSASVSFGAMGVIASSFTFTGAFFDLVRSDSLMIFVVTLSVAFAFVGRRWPSAVVAGILIALAFLTKQTASLLGIALGVSLLLANWRRGVVYGFAAAVVLAAGLGYLQWRSGGWFWTYVFELHQSHGFNKVLAYQETPVRLLRVAWPLYAALVTAFVTLALGRRLERNDVIPVAVAAAGFLTSCIGFGTQWAFDNAFIPAIVFPAIATAILGARLVSVAPVRLGAAMFSICVAAGVGYASVKEGVPDKQAMVPTQSDRRAARHLIQTIAQMPGEGFVPFHPFYAVMAGKKPFVHRMGVMDVAAKLGRPAGLDEAIANGRFDFVVLDWKSRPYEWPGLETRYYVLKELEEGVDSARMFSGAQTSPRQLLVPLRPSQPLPAGARMANDFETGDFSGWQVEGTAFGSSPMPAPPSAFGRFAASSNAPGVSAKGVLRSTPFVITGSAIRLWVDAPVDPALRVSLQVGADVPRNEVPNGKAHWIEWSTEDLIGQSAILMVEDQSSTAAITIDDVQIVGAP